MRFNRIKNGYTITDTAQRLRIHPTTLSTWVKRLESPESICCNSRDKETPKRAQMSHRGERYLKKGRSVLELYIRKSTNCDYLSYKSKTLCVYDPYLKSIFEGLKLYTR